MNWKASALVHAKEQDPKRVAQYRQAVWNLHSRTASELLVDKGNVEETQDWIHNRMQL